MLQPEAVHRDARGDGVGLGHDGLRQLEAAAAVVEGGAVALRERLEEAAGDRGAALVLVAAQVDVAVAGAGGILDRHGLARGAGVGEAQLIDLGPAEIGDRLAIVLAAENRAVLPVGAELAGIEERDALLVLEDLLDVGQRPRVGRHLRDRRRRLLARAAGRRAAVDVGEDGGLAVVVGLLVGQGDVVDGLGLEAAQGRGDERVDRVLGVVQGGGEHAGGALLEDRGGDGRHAGEGPGDGGVGLDAHRLEVGQGRLQLVLLVHVAPLDRAALERGGDQAAGHLAVVAGAHVLEVLVVAGGALRLQLVEALLEIGLQGRALGAGGDARALERLDRRGEDAVQRIIVGRGDRVELVVVATRAGDRQAEEGLGRGVDALVDRVVDVVEALADGDEAEGREAGVVGLDVRELVGGELLDHEAVVGFVGVERVDDVIAVGPGEGVAVVLVEALALVDRQAARVGVAGRIEPVAAPALAVVRRGQEEVDLLGDDRVDVVGRGPAADGGGIGGGRGVMGAGEGDHLIRGGREAEEVVGHAAQEGLRVGRRVGHEARGLELGEDEGVNRALDPGLVLHFRRRDGLEREVGPVLLGLLGQAGEFVAVAGRGGGAHLDPLLERGDLGVGDLATLLLRRHGDLGVAVMDGQQQERLGDVTGHHGRTLVAALEHAVARIEDQAALRGAFLDRVTLVAMLGEDRADVLLEELETLLGRLIGGEQQRTGGQHGEQGKETARGHGEGMKG